MARIGRRTNVKTAPAAEEQDAYQDKQIEEMKAAGDKGKPKVKEAAVRAGSVVG
jgi:hypothetical protein